MKRFLLIAAVGVLALVLNGDSASAQKHNGGPSRGPHGSHFEHGSRSRPGRVLPRGLHGRALPGDFARFSRFRYDARYRSRFYLSGNSWYYWYAPFRYYLPVEVIETYPPVVVTSPAVVVPPSVIVPPTVMPPADEPE